MACRADVVPRISYASVESLFLEFANASPIGNLGRKVTQTLPHFKVPALWFQPGFSASLKFKHLNEIRSSCTSCLVGEASLSWPLPHLKHTWKIFDSYSSGKML